MHVVCTELQTKFISFSSFLISKEGIDIGPSVKYYIHHRQQLHNKIENILVNSRPISQGLYLVTYKCSISIIISQSNMFTLFSFCLPMVLQKMTIFLFNHFDCMEIWSKGSTRCCLTMSSLFHRENHCMLLLPKAEKTVTEPLFPTETE